MSETGDSGKTLWHGRYEAEAAESLRRLNDSLPFDKRLYADDILCSIEYAQALARAEVISSEEAKTIDAGLRAVLKEFESGTFVPAPGDEDIHTAVERRLGELIGATAGKLHTGRSRNDQVATDVRHWQMSHIDKIAELVWQLQANLLGQAQQHADTLIPGYTHLRAAQPITAAHWLLSYFWMLARDFRRFEACWETTAVSPLGSGALAGTPYPIDRLALALGMGFEEMSRNSLDAVSDRDFIVEFLSAASLLMV